MRSKPRFSFFPEGGRSWGCSEGEEHDLFDIVYEFIVLWLNSNLHLVFSYQIMIIIYIILYNIYKLLVSYGIMIQNRLIY